MSKTFVEFKQEDQEGSLELSAYALSPEEHKAVMAELEAVGPTLDFTYIDADSIMAIVRDEQHNVLDLVKELQASGWTWNE